MSDVVVVSMTCMTTKKKFEVENPTVVVLRNGRYAYRCECPWQGKNGKQLFAFKFCSAADYDLYKSSQAEDEEEVKSEHSSESEH